MTDQQFLGVNTVSDKTEIKNALINKISDLDFEIDIEKIFNYIHCSQRLIKNTDSIATDDEIVITDEYREIIKDFNAEDYGTPEGLIRYFEILYDNPATRFNKFLWKAVLDSLKAFRGNELENYLQPAADFLNAKPFLKSDVLFLIDDTFPFGFFFPKTKNEENKEFWQQYGFVHHLLSAGNLELDLHADVINTGQFSGSQLDDIYKRLMNSSNYYRNNLLPQAFNALSDGLPAEIKPLLIWQRELNILYKAVFVEKVENITDIFQNTLHSALTAFPDDEQLLYIRAKFFSHFYEPEQFKEKIIETLKLIPNHAKCLFLLGKCYLQLESPRAALIIFENLKKINPLNMQYVTSAAIASRKYIDFCISEHDPKDNHKQYYVNIISTLIEKEMFDEVRVFADEAPKQDGDIRALLLYSNDVETFLVTGEKNKEELIEALSLTKDKEIIRKIKEHYLHDLLYFSEIQSEKDFIFEYYRENPNDSMANYQMGMFYFADNNHEKAYDFLLKAKEINPDKISNYYNLARVTSILGIHSEALEYANIYLLYNKYNVIVNEIYCDCTYSLQQYRNAHNGAKWLLSICRNNEFDPKYFFYFTTSLSYYMDKIETEHHNAAYVNDMLELYDKYPKPDSFWTNDNGSRSMYWAANLCYKTGNYDKGLDYLQCILENVKEYNWPLLEKCKFQLLPECLHGLQQYEKLIHLLEMPTLEVLQKQPDDPSVRLSCFYISYAYSVQGNDEKKMQWALSCIKCYLQMDNPPVDWLANNLLVNFQACLEKNMKSYLVAFGTIYLDFIKTPQPGHVWLTHHFANFYLEEGNQYEALKYHKMCIEFGWMFPDEWKELIDNSQDFINAFNLSENLK
ncbi:tetratricopeptide repeat protein [Flavobacterium limi]|uniref:Tetratricopeptide repeat-containing protein n=1 Tax=Flavobacterium limi TaxID=2045105 RepID=A0ABQ1UL45_9FLAO|nr:tetratricopeptide repeat protein [Flavobacterium limi]GGF21402.1 hypothetical protein GCM10011518_33220 [Flavobacterium limi]